jgi:PIN domain nuclease of toxin-antitoxin system
VVLEEAMYLIPKRFNLESAASIGYSEQNFIMGRSLGIGTISVYQLWDSVSPVVHANSLTKILFRGEDIEKIKKAINLSDDHLDYLPHLPDRYFIIKSKSLSGPALLKTRIFRKKPVTNKQYRILVQQKYLENGHDFSRINKSLMEIRKLAFSNSKGTKIRNWMDNPNISVFADDKNLKERNSKILEKKAQEKHSFYGSVWENCIDTCIARISFQEKHSSWIQENICKKTKIIASKIAKELLAKSDLVPILKITKKNPLHLTKRILLKTNKMEINHPNILCFCIMNLILEYIRKEEKLDFNWKNKSLANIRNYLIKHEMPNQQY